MILKQFVGLPNYGWRSAFNELENMRHNMNHLFGQVSGRPYWQSHAGVFPLVNIAQDADHYFIRAEIPGMESKGIIITATDQNLTISGERKIASEGENVRYHRREREGGTFNRVISLPKDIQTDKIVARYVDGILSIKIPKAEVVKARQIEIK